MQIKSSSPFVSMFATLHRIAGYMFVKITQSGDYVFMLNGEVYIAQLEVGTYQLPTQHDEDDWVVGWQDAVKFPFLPKSIAKGIRELKIQESAILTCDSKEGWVDVALTEEGLVFDTNEESVALSCTNEDLKSLESGYGVRLHDEDGKLWELWKEKQVKPKRTH